MKKLIKKWWFWLIVGIVLLGVLGVIFGDTEVPTVDPNNNNTSVSEQVEEEYTSNKKINHFINKYNEINPDYAFSKEMISNNLTYKIYIHNTGLKNIEILSKTDNGKDMISIDMENYGDTTLLRERFGTMMKVFVHEINSNTIDELWDKLINGHYMVNYADNKDALEYKGVYMSFSDSGDVQVYGKPHICYVRIYGEFK